MANRKAYMNYAIYFTDKAEYDAARAGGITIQTSPSHAAALFDLPFPVPGGSLGSKGMYYFSPYTPGAQLNQNSGVFVDDTVDSFLLPGGADPFGNVYPDTDMVWVGAILLQGNGAPSKVPQVPTTTTTQPPIPPPPQNAPPGHSPPPAPVPPGPPPQPPAVPISQRRWAIGFELPGGGEADGSNQFNCCSREGSRTAEGFGLCLRGPTDVFSMTVGQYGGAASVPSSWERMYIRVRKTPGVASQWWRTHGTPSDGSGIALSITPAGAIQIENDANGPRTILATTSGLVLNTWYRLDMLITYNSQAAGGAGAFVLYRNGAKIVDLTIPLASGGLGQGNSKHVRSVIGTNTPAQSLELDVDDWINAEYPANFGAIDWVSGSHVMRVFPNGFAASHNAAAWPGDYRVLLQVPPFSTAARLVSTTAGSRIAVTTDAVAGPITQFGVAALTVGIYSSRAANNGTLGYSLAGGAPVLSAIAQQTTILSNSVMYRPSGLTPAAPPPYPPNSPTLPTVFPIELYHEKGAGSGSSSVGMLMASMECLGAWGPEDGIYNDPTIPVIVRSTDIHNAPYVRYELSGKVTAPNRAVTIIGGLYNGNNLGQDIALPAPPHWWWIRRVSTSNGSPNQWHSSAVAPNNLGSETVNPEVMVRAVMDLSGNVKIQISGSNIQINATGEVYQWIAVCDPGMRYMLNGAFSHINTLGTVVNALQNPTFLPDAAFCLVSTMGSNPSQGGYWYRGPGHTASNAQVINAAETANMLSFALGSLTSVNGTFYPSFMRGGVSYSVLRMVDPDCPDVGVVFQILSYTGNGAGGTRVINLAPLSARWPLLALVLPHNAAGVYRDPSHTGVNSTLLSSGANTVTGITAGGVDSITVGTTLNVLNVVHDVFIIPGSPFGWNNGTFQPVAPCSSCNDTFPCPPEPTPAPNLACHDQWGLGQSTDLPYTPLTP
jgi:hypothetical protein